MHAGSPSMAKLEARGSGMQGHSGHIRHLRTAGLHETLPQNNQKQRGGDFCAPPHNPVLHTREFLSRQDKEEPEISIIG